ncbi:MAG TPA: redoxin domain-containing protein [Actinomycetota bacterium]|nr:redoxin domain-containing protein [Actinomycetota bacterium]
MTAPWIAAFALLWIAVLLVLFLQLGQFRRAIQVLETAERQLQGSPPHLSQQGLPPGSRIPDIEARDPDGVIVRRADLAGLGGIFLFLSSDCGPCRDLLEDLGRNAGWDGSLPLIAVIDDTPEARLIRFPPGITVLYQTGEAVSRAFDTAVTPHAFLIDARGTVMHKVIPNTAEQLQELARKAHVLPAGGRA